MLTTFVHQWKETPADDAGTTGICCSPCFESQHGAGRRLWVQFSDIREVLCGFFSGSPAFPPKSTDIWLAGKLSKKGVGQLEFIVEDLYYG